MTDIYEPQGTYFSTPQEIYDGLARLCDTEEMDILSEMFQDVSTERQGYYYYDQGHALKEKFDALTEWGNKLWIMDLAIFQINHESTEIHDIVYLLLCDDDMAKRVGFKKIFTDRLWYEKKDYERIAEMFREEAGELNRFTQHEMIMAWRRVMEQNGTPQSVVSPYPAFATEVYKKVMGLRLDVEKTLLIQAKALLAAYDDFMLGLRMNQVLYNRLEEGIWRQRYEALAEQTKYILAEAARQGVALRLGEDIKLLTEGQ
jgi:uncharacterized protein (DUF2164 family)